MNVQSYQIFESLLWSNFHREINRWRTRTLRLPKVRTYANSPNLVVAAKLPFSAMWSPGFVPKPGDWPEQCEVVGTFVIDQKQNFDVTPFADLKAWLDSGEKPIFIGFGSMVIKEPQKLEEMIKKAAHRLNFRIVVQSSWTKLDVEDGSDLLRNVGPCPHDWLLPQCRAVVHHGGAGTVAAGLRMGLPTFVCPFFADQFMWGFFVATAGVGPKDCPVTRLTEDILVERLEALSDPNIIHKAKEVAAIMATEDGIQGGLFHFLESLPRDSMLCDVSLLMGETVKARYELVGTHLRNNGIKVSSEVAAMLENDRKIALKTVWNWIPTKSSFTDRYWYSNEMRRHAWVRHGLTGRIKHFYQGFFAAITGVIVGFFSSLMQIYYVSDQYARLSGAFGCIFGVIMSVFYLLYYLLLAILTFFDRLLVGITNGFFGADYDYLINPTWETKVHQTPFLEAEKESFRVQGIPKARKDELQRALEVVVNARIIFESAKPSYPDEHRHFLVVRLDNLIKKLHTKESKQRMRMSTREVEALVERLEHLLHIPTVAERRATLFPGLKALQRTFFQLTTSAIKEEVGGEEESKDFTASAHSHGEASQSEKRDSSGDPELKRPVLSESKSVGSTSSKPSRVTTLVSSAVGSRRRMSEDVGISFSLFIRCLSMVCAESVKCQSRRLRRRSLMRSSLMVSGRKWSEDMSNLEDFSTYLE